MTKFDSTTTPEAKKRGFNELTTIFYPFWEPLFSELGIADPVFKSKLCYRSGEFDPENPEKVPAGRFFENELNNPHDLYIELCDWDHNFYDPMYRKLYRLPANPHWQSEPDQYVKSNNPKHPTYAVKLSDMELVNETSITQAIPTMEASATKNDSFDEEEEAFSDIYEEMEDNHTSSMTIRDLYCMLQNVPLSNKKWLNSLIEKGKQWQK